MIKRTLFFGNPCVLRKKDMQLQVEYPEKEKKTVPIEDIGIIILEEPQIQISNALLAALNENNTAVVICNEKHMPYGLLLPMFSHTTFTEKFYTQLEASVPMKKNLWQQTVTAKIKNQAALLESLGIDAGKLYAFARKVRSGDPDNLESTAASFYWEHLFTHTKKFTRHRFGDPPNNMLNYAYAILRAVIARSLIGSGLFPSVGIHHKNKYNPYCLADDIMEPYRPYADLKVIEVMKEFGAPEELTPEIKKKLLSLPVMDIVIEGKSSPLMVGAQRTTASLAACFEGSARKILYPVMENKTVSL